MTYALFLIILKFFSPSIPAVITRKIGSDLTLQNSIKYICILCAGLHFSNYYYFIILYRFKVVYKNSTIIIIENNKN